LPESPGNSNVREYLQAGETDQLLICGEIEGDRRVRKKTVGRVLVIWQWLLSSL
jgi:hypothetical protein